MSGETVGNEVEQGTLVDVYQRKVVQRLMDVDIVSCGLTAGAAEMYRRLLVACKDPMACLRDVDLREMEEGIETMNLFNEEWAVPILERVLKQADLWSNASLQVVVMDMIEAGGSGVRTVMLDNALLTVRNQPMGRGVFENSDQARRFLSQQVLLFKERTGAMMTTIEFIVWAGNQKVPDEWRVFMATDGYGELMRRLVLGAYQDAPGPSSELVLRAIEPLVREWGVIPIGGQVESWRDRVRLELAEKGAIFCG